MPEEGFGEVSVWGDVLEEVPAGTVVVVEMEFGLGGEEVEIMDY